MKRSRLWLALAVLSAALLVTSTSGFSMASMDRGVSISVADNPANAMIGITHDGPVRLTYGSTKANGSSPHSEKVRLLTVTNNAGQRIDVSVVVTGDEPGPPNLQNGPWMDDNHLSVGESSSVAAEAVCAHQGPETWNVTVTADGDGMSAVVHHDVTVVCTGPPGGTPGDASNTSSSS